MFDELERLATDEPLSCLLRHYAHVPTDQRGDWQDRLMALEGVRREALVRLHGELLANGWVEQNTGTTPAARSGAVVQCYRATTAGRRALRDAANLDALRAEAA